MRVPDACVQPASGGSQDPGGWSYLCAPPWPPATSAPPHLARGKGVFTPPPALMHTCPSPQPRNTLWETRGWPHPHAGHPRPQTLDRGEGGGVGDLGRVCGQLLPAPPRVCPAEAGGPAGGACVPACAHTCICTDVHTCASHENMFISYTDVQTCTARTAPPRRVHRTPHTHRCRRPGLCLAPSDLEQAQPGPCLTALPQPAGAGTPGAS